MTSNPKESTLVKICGIKEEATLLGMKGLPVEYIGFVFAKSRRQLTAEQAGVLITTSRDVLMAHDQPARTVGVFVNPTIEQLAEVLDEAKLDVVQLHGEESPEFCREVRDRFGVEVWRALPVPEDGGGVERLVEYAGAVSTILLDTAGGGTGKTFRWDVIPSYQVEARRLGLQLFIAGGLSADNADELTARYRPDGVDISSGVETDGIKDLNKITAFAEKVANS
jgi:phosphoribosylanthranilate isomerase